MRRVLLPALLVGLTTCAGCGPTGEPARFIPAAAEPGATGSPADRAETPTRTGPSRNIEMH